MNWNAIFISPIMGEDLTEENTLKLDFSPANKELDSVDLGNTEKFSDFIFTKLSSQQKQFGIGGYLEHRAIYQRSDVFATHDSDFRNIHLGVDIWAKAGTAIYVPLDGTIHSFQNNEGFGNYGATIILEHEIQGERLFTLYGHLMLSDLKKIYVGQKVKAGDLLCHIGPFPENGDWPPHLHFQLMKDLLGNQGDFLGVCAQKDIEKYREICPDPNVILKCPLL